MSHVADPTTRTAVTAEAFGATATELATSGEQLTAAVSRFRLGPRMPGVTAPADETPAAPVAEASSV